MNMKYCLPLILTVPQGDTAKTHPTAILTGGGHGFQGQNELDALAYTYAFIMNHIVA